MPSDLDIARRVSLKRIEDLAAAWGIEPAELLPFGHYKAKVDLRILDRLRDRPDGRYIVMTAVTPTPLGEGKTVNTIGTALGLNKIGKRAIPTIRQASMGPIFGIKGGAAGGGWSQVLPLEEVNLGLTGDIHAVSIAHNLCAAFLDNHILKGNRLGFNVNRIAWKRVVDLNDRALRDVVVGLGGIQNGVPRQTGFVIAVASELMAILALAEDVHDLRRRIGRIVIGFDDQMAPITAEELKVAGAMTALLADTLKPNLLQTTEGTPAFIHTGPFANIAHGNSSIIADRIALKLADYVVTEAGFGADMGAEKFFNIKCRTSGLTPDAAGLVVTVRALKHHSGRFDPGQIRQSHSDIDVENLEAVRAGSENLRRQIANVHAHGVPVVVIVNRFPQDHPAELALVQDLAREFGAERVVVSEAFEKGGDGARDVAAALVEVCEGNGRDFKHLYPLDAPIKEKIEAIATTLYGAREVHFHRMAVRRIKRWEGLGAGNLPICMAKTQASLSHDPSLLGAPSGYRFIVDDLEASLGAGFLTPICGGMNLMPGLPATPGGEHIDIDEQGRITGLF